MKRPPNLWSLIFASVLIFSLVYRTVPALIITRSAAQEQTNKVLSEEAFLSPVNAFGDTTQYVVAISDDLLCGVSQSRLKIFSKDNVENVISSYWTPYRLPRVFEYYKGYIYLVQANRRIGIFDVRDPRQITFVTKLDIPMHSYAQIELKDNKLFMVDNNQKASLIIYSLANPEAPQQITRYSLPEHLPCGSKVSVSGGTIYVLCSNGLGVLEATDLKSPQLLGSVEIKSKTSLGAFIVKGTYAYVFVADEIRIFDISRPEAIEEKTAVKATWCPHAVLRGNYFMGFGGNGVFIYDLSDPLKPKRIRKYYNDIPGFFLIGKEQDYLVDDTGEAKPVTGLPHFRQVQSRFGFRADNIVVRDKFAYAFASGQLWILDISTPWAPKQISGLRISTGGRDTVLLEDRYLYTPRQIIDISDPAKPTIVKSLKGGSGVTLENKHLFIANRSNLDILDINDPAEATMVKSISFDEQINKVFVHKGILYLGFYRGKLRSCRLEDDLTLRKLDEIELAKGTHGIIMDFCQEDDFLYAALNEDGICSVDIQDPNNLELHARFNTSQFSEQIEVVDAYAYVADGSGGTFIIDMGEKGYEKIIASYPTTDWTRAIAVSDNYVYSCDGDSGIMIFRSNLPELDLEQAVAYTDGKSEAEQAKENTDKKEYQPGLQSESLSPATITQSKLALERYAKTLIAEGALLEPINAIGDNCQYVCAINDGLMCGVSRLRLKIFQKDNIENVLSSYWTKARFPRIFECYRGYIYLPQPYKGIWVFDARNPIELRLIRQLDIPFGYHTNIVVRDDKLLYIDPKEGALVVLSLTDPAVPLEVSRCALGTNMRDKYKANIQIVGDRIYVLGQRCLVVIDGQDLYSPRLLGTVDIDSSSGSSALAVSGPYAYIYDSEDRQIHIFDVSNPEAIEHKAATNAVRGGQWERCAVVRDTHIITFGEGVYIYGITDPLKPQLVRQHYNFIPGDFLIGKDQDYVVDDGKAESLTGLPYLVQGYGGRLGFSVDKIAIRNKFAYVFGGQRLRIFDISRPWSPKQVASLAGCSVGLASLPIDDNHIYTPRQIIDISEPARPTIIKTLSTGHAVARTAEHLIIVTEDSLRIWDVQTPAEAKSVKSISLGARANALCFHQGILYIGFHRPKLWSCVLEDDLTLTVLDEIDLAKSDNGIIMDLCREGDFLYVALGRDGVASVDISDPQNLTEYARLDTTHAQDIEVVNAYVYVAGGPGGAIIVDLSEKGNERKIASHPPAHWTRAVAVSGNYVYSGDEEYGITVFVSNLSNER